jgi:hypothetical protein
VALNIESLIVVPCYFGLDLIRGFGGTLASRPIRASAPDFSSSAPISRAFSMNSLDCSLSCGLLPFIEEIRRVDMLGLDFLDKTNLHEKMWPANAATSDL